MNGISRKLRGPGLALFLVVCVAVASLGCVAAAVGGAAVVGYEVVKDDRAVGTKVDDAFITSTVKTRFISDDQVHAIDINVDTFEGVVTLHGHVPSSGVRNRAEAIARSVKGVKSVQSRLSVVPE